PSSTSPHLHSFPTRRSSDLTGVAPAVLLPDLHDHNAAQYRSSSDELLLSGRVVLRVSLASRLSGGSHPDLLDLRDLFRRVGIPGDRKSTRLTSRHGSVSHAV